MTREDAIRRLAKVQVWSWIAGAYFACLSPIWSDGLTFATIGGALCMGILVTYVVIRIYHDLLLVGDWIARLAFRWRV
jgi:hypothetical protein